MSENFEKLTLELQQASIGLREAVEGLEEDLNRKPINFEEVNSSFDEIAEYFVRLQSRLKNHLYTLPSDKT